MIHHFSIAARDPEHVVAVLAEVIGGELGRRVNRFDAARPQDSAQMGYW
jgi:hypothetical protein